MLDRIEYLEVKAKRLAKDQLEYVFELSYAIEPLGTRPLVEIMAESERTLYKKKREFDKLMPIQVRKGFRVQFVKSVLCLLISRFWQQIRSAK